MEKYENKKKNKMKTFVLDTNIILHNPNSLLSFDDNKVILPDVVIDELDKKKRAPGEIGWNAREASRLIDKIDEESDGNLLDGCNLPNGGIFKVEMNFVETAMPETWEKNNDLRILRVCKGLKESGEDIILVTNDIFVKTKAKMLGIKAEPFTTEFAPTVADQYTGRRVGYATSDIINSFYKDGKITPKQVSYFDEDGMETTLAPLVLHEYILIKSSDTDSQSALGFFDGEYIRLIKDSKKSVYSITPKNVAQTMALHAIKNQDCPLTIIKGPAGTGKTLLAIAAGLEAVEQGTYRKILYLRGNVKLDEDIGFLPGTEEEKLDWILRPVRDNLETIFGGLAKDDYSSGHKTKKGKTRYSSKYDEENDDKSFFTPESVLKDKVDEVFSRGIINVEAVGHMRGRSLANLFVIIDEAQNLTPKQIRTLATRPDEGTKIVILGDPAQIDHQYLDARTNGLCVASDKMAGSEYTVQMTFFNDECERSALSEDVAIRMGDK